MNIIEPILFQCRLNPLATAICVPGSSAGSVNYGMLERLIHNVARSALRAGITRGNLIAIYVSDDIAHAALILGLTHIGAATVSLREPKPLAGIVPDVVVTDTPGKFAAGQTVLALDRSWLEGDGTNVRLPIASTDEDDTCRIILTSGSTGVPKGIAFSHRTLASRIAHYTYSKGPQFAHCARFFCALGIATSPGFRYAMALLSRGGTIYFGPNFFDLLQTFDLHKIQGMACTPHTLVEFLKYFETDPSFEAPFKHIICQGAKLSRDLSLRARARICQNLYTSYGSTETTTVAFGPSSLLERIPGSVGFVQPGVTAEIVDESGAVLPPSRDGRLRVRTSHMASGYVNDVEATRAVFRDGYFYTGDIGHLTPEGILAITGREKTALNVGGETVNPETVEDVITSFPDVQDAGVFVQDNEFGIAELCALIVTRRVFSDAELVQYCASKLETSTIPSRFIVIDALPRGGQGKLERHRLPFIAAAKVKQSE